MAGAAWAMLGVTWSVNLVKVLRNPTPPESPEGPDIPFKDA